ncbi:MAG: InlB B-repeat-containing protein, partial [Bacilli bacterium]|nr:InlB B-repeat-containing protein [Bacilli bacterium]
MKKTFKIYIIATILIVLLLISGCQKKYTVTFMDYNGAVFSEQIVKQSEDATAPTIPLREGYEFIGWSKEYTNIQEDIVLIAQYKKIINTYTVRFLDYDNTLLKTEQIEENGNATPPSTPSREGYEFIGWDQNYINVKQNLDIYAQYKEIIITYTVTFMDYNGKILSKQTIKQSENATPPSTPSREGYKFIGWNNDYTNIQDDIIITAQYEKIINTYTVRFLDYDNTLLKTEQIEENGNATPPSTPSREGYEFIGWDQNYINVKQNLDIYAQYKETIITYTVTFMDYNGTILSKQTIKQSENATPPSTPSREGYKFIGWNNDYNNVQDDIIITAQYEKIINTYTVSFISYDNIIVETQSVEKGEKALEPASPLREGYIFNGWYLNEEKWSFIGYSITSDIILEAKWTAIQYNIMYELNGGETNNPTTYTVEDKIILTNPKKTGYTFLGWT